MTSNSRSPIAEVLIDLVSKDKDNAPNPPVVLSEVMLNRLTCRQIQEGKELIDQEEAVVRGIPPEDLSAPRMFYVLAAWCEYSKTAAEIASVLNRAYSQNPWPGFSLVNWAWIVAGKALFALYEGRYEDIDEAWRWVQENAGKLNAGHEVLATVDFAKAQGKRKCADYKLGLELIQSALFHYREINLPGMVAVAQALEGWLWMQVGDMQQAARSWDAAHAFLKTTDDWVLLGNLIFAQARRCCRAGLEKEARKLFIAAAALHERSVPYHRNLRHIYTDLADLEFRMWAKPEDPELWKSACAHLEKAEELLQHDPADYRNRIRLLLAQTNKALAVPNPAFYKAHRTALQAYELAKKRGEKLMIARARYKQAIVEKRDAKEGDCEDPVRKLAQACRYAYEALQLAGLLHNDRLAARIHTLLGNLFLEFPFCDPQYAEQHWEAAVLRMSQHEDLDYVVKQITALGKRLESPEQLPDKSSLIISITDLAFGKRLDETLRKVEQAIVLALIKEIGPNERAIAQTLQTGRQRIRRYLVMKRPGSSAEPVQTHNVIFKVKASFAFSRPLEETIKAVERAIIRAAWIFCGYDKTAAKDNLHIGFDKVVSALEDD